MGDKTEATMDRTYDFSIKCGTVAPFYPRLLSFFSRCNYVENEYNVASYRLMPTKSNVASIDAFGQMVSF